MIVTLHTEDLLRQQGPRTVQSPHGRSSGVSHELEAPGALPDVASADDVGPVYDAGPHPAMAVAFRSGLALTQDRGPHHGPRGRVQRHHSRDHQAGVLLPQAQSGVQGAAALQ